MLRVAPLNGSCARWDGEEPSRRSGCARRSRIRQPRGRMTSLIGSSTPVHRTGYGWLTSNADVGIKYHLLPHQVWVGVHGVRDLVAPVAGPETASPPAPSTPLPIPMAVPFHTTSRRGVASTG